MHLGSTLQGVLTDVKNWLGQHKREFVILIFQQQGKAKGLTGDISKNVNQLVRTTFGTDLYAEAKPDVPPLQLLRINHMSYSNLRYQPWESGEGVNTLLRKSNIKIKGVLMIDDADQATVDHILKNNA